MHSTDFWTAFVDAQIQWLGHRFSGFSGWAIVGYALLTTHITIVSVTVFLHRSQAHRALHLHPGVSHFFRLWLWLIEIREKLQRLWTSTNVSKAQLVVDLQSRLHEAEASGIASLHEFALRLRSVNA